MKKKDALIDLLRTTNNMREDEIARLRTKCSELDDEIVGLNEALLRKSRDIQDVWHENDMLDEEIESLHTQLEILGDEYAVLSEENDELKHKLAVYAPNYDRSAEYQEFETSVMSKSQAADPSVASVEEEIEVRVTQNVTDSSHCETSYYVYPYLFQDDDMGKYDFEKAIAGPFKNYSEAFGWCEEHSEIGLTTISTIVPSSFAEEEA